MPKGPRCRTEKKLHTRAVKKISHVDSNKLVWIAHLLVSRENGHLGCSFAHHHEATQIEHVCKLTSHPSNTTQHLFHIFSPALLKCFTQLTGEYIDLTPCSCINVHNMAPRWNVSWTDLFSNNTYTPKEMGNIFRSRWIFCFIIFFR